jgi:hypothetical protein
VPSHRAETTTPLRRPRTHRTAPRGRSAGPARSPFGNSPARAALLRNSLSAPKVGIAGALGIATIAAPISGAMASAMPKAELNPIRVHAFMPAPAVPALPDTSGMGVKVTQVVPATSFNSAVPAALAAPSKVIVSKASRSGEQSVLPNCSGVDSVPKNAQNGQLPAGALCTLWNPKHRLRADAAVALAKLNIAYKQKFGNNICLTDSYRTLAVQERLKITKPGLAATPGTSEHGWGLAVDLCDGIETGQGARYQWLRENAPDYGWNNPDWARVGGGGPYEPWHWEYVAGE